MADGRLSDDRLDAARAALLGDDGDGLMQLVHGLSIRQPTPPNERAHALGTELRPDDVVAPTPISVGDVTVHNERVLHGSGGNTSDGFRRAYVLAFRSVETITTERDLGFTHSHNDDDTVLDEVGVAGESR